ncbi:Uma2 family endonuclease [Craurococcus roseus]|uniref:Uma2 family endonuclease n=1 Tax=Craurococcus roseus TaxID=77585 RepID=UPI0038D047CC
MGVRWGAARAARHGRRHAAPCPALDAAAGCLVGARGRVRYPDATVECGRDDDGDVATPAVVFEVLSPTTERTERGTEAQDYAAEPCLLAPSCCWRRTGQRLPCCRVRWIGGRRSREGRARPSPCRRSGSICLWRRYT